LAEQDDRLRLHDLDTDLGHDPSPALVQRLHRVRRQHLVPRHAVDEHRTLRDLRAAGGPSADLRAAVGPSASTRLTLGRRRSYYQDLEHVFHMMERSRGTQSWDTRDRTGTPDGSNPTARK